MSETGKAVFLSYASQDADAARRIAEALRAAGVEVWFDQSELVGGDAWDQKIRKQIRECALLIPIISAATQARTEGYFRLEWRLADQRTHLMAKGRPFLLPVVIDDTRDADAAVPDSFTDVQWTRASGGETSPAFCTHVKKLLGGSEAGAASAAIRDSTTQRIAAEAAPTRRPAWFVSATLALVVLVTTAALAIWQPWRRATPSQPQPVSAVSTELARVRARIIPDRWQREDFAVVSAMLDRLIQNNPEEADAWALRSLINSLQVVRNFDAGTRPLEAGKTDADRARRLAPDSPLADLAYGMHLGAMASRGGDAAACRPYIDRAVAALPPDGLTRYAELVSYWFGYEFEDVHRVATAWLAAEPHASFPAWILSQSSFVQRQPDEAEKWAEQAAVDTGITGVRAHYTRFESRYYLRADLRGAREALEKIPAAGRNVHRVVHARWLVAMIERRWDDALQELVRVPEPLLFDRSYHGPKALLAGLAHLRAGRAEAAAVQFREAERLLREQLAADPDNEGLHGVLAVVLAYDGRGAEARNELALFEPLVRGRAPTLQRGSLALLIAQTYAVLGESKNLAFWLRLLLAEPSQFAFTPASIRLDPRFTGATDAPEIVALLTEFAALDQPLADVATSKADDKSAPADKSVAVLPFRSRSIEKENEYLAEGISEELRDLLSNVPGLRVAGWMSAYHFKGRPESPAEIGSALNVSLLLSGNVEKSGDQVRIRARLTRTDTGNEIWNQEYKREVKDVFSLEDEIAHDLTGRLQLALGASPTPKREVNPEAHALVLEGLHFWNLRTYPDMDRAESAFRRAIDIDHAFAPAHAGLAAVLVTRTIYRRLDGLTVEYDDLEPSRSEARLAISLDRESGDPYGVLGFTYALTGEVREAEENFRQAQTFSLQSAIVPLYRQGLLSYQGRLDLAIAENQKALERDPLSSMALWLQAENKIHAQRYAEALVLNERIAEIRSDVWSPNRGAQARILVPLGRTNEAVAIVREMRKHLDAVPRLNARDAEAVWTLRQAGLENEAADYADAVFPYLAKNSYAAGNVLAALGRFDEALPALEHTPPLSMHMLYWNTIFDPYRDDPRFRALMEKLGCTAYYAVARETLDRMLHEKPADK